MTKPLLRPQRALAIGSHPDDIEFGAGGTLAAWAEEGCDIVLVIMTDGSKGTWDPGQSSTELVAQRQAEQRTSAAMLGAGDVVFLDHVDGELEYSMEVRSEVAALIRTHRPGVVLSHDPWARYETHPDHRATGWAVIDGAVAARDHLFFPEHGLAHHRPDSLLLWSAAEPDHWEDIASVFSTKLAALLCHESQHHTTMDRAGDGDTERELFEQRVRAEAARQGAAAGLAAAEAFKRIRL